MYDSFLVQIGLLDELCIISYFASDVYDENGRDAYESKDLPLCAWVVAKIAV